VESDSTRQIVQRRDSNDELTILSQKQHRQVSYCQSELWLRITWATTKRTKKTTTVSASAQKVSAQKVSAQMSSAPVVWDIPMG
jgi:sulfur transfer protein SufE